MKNNSKGLNRYISEVKKTALLSAEEEEAIAKRIKSGDLEARDELIKANLLLVVKIAHSYRGNGIPLSDLVSEGNIGLMRAADLFKPNKGARFSTYAAYWIKQSIKRAISNKSKIIRLPVHAIDKLSKMNKLSQEIREETGEEATDEKLAELMDLPVRKIKLLKRSVKSPVSLDAPLYEDSAVGLAEVVPDEHTVHPVEVMEQREDFFKLHELIQELSEREAYIISARFGLGGCKERTLSQIGHELGYTRERIRQLQNQALEKMRSALKRHDEPCQVVFMNKMLRSA